jgi:hypothetical protein
MSKSPEQNRMNEYKAKDGVEKTTASIKPAEPANYNEAEKIIEKKERLIILEEILEHIKSVLNQGEECQPHSISTINISYSLVKQLGIDELGLDLVKIGIADFIEIIKDTNIKEQPSSIIPHDSIIIDNISHEHKYATRPFYFLKEGRGYEIPAEMEVIIKEINKLTLNIYLLSKSYGHAAQFYKNELNMPEKAVEMKKLMEKYPYDMENQKKPDLHLCPPLEAILAEFWSNIKDNPYVITKEGKIKIIEDLKKKVEAEINRLKNLLPS